MSTNDPTKESTMTPNETTPATPKVGDRVLDPDHDVVQVSWEMGPTLYAEGLVGLHGTVAYCGDAAETWNGWLVPLFNATQMEAVIAATADAPERVARPLVTPVEAFVLVNEDGDEFPLQTRTLPDGTTVWGIDGWTWETDS